MKDKNEESIRDLVEYVIVEGYGLWTKLPKRDAARWISRMVYQMIIANGYIFDYQRVGTTSTHDLPNQSKICPLCGQIALRTWVVGGDKCVQKWVCQECEYTEAISGSLAYI